MSTLDMRAERKRLIDELRATIDQAESENRDLSGEELEKEQRLTAEVDALTNRIERSDKMAELARYSADTSAGGEPVVAFDDRGAAELRAFFAGEGDRRRDFQLRHDLNTGTAAQGGDLVDQDFVTQLYEEMDEFSVIRQAGPTRLVTTRGDDLVIPKTDAFTSASIIGEGNQISKSNPTFEQVTIGAYKYAAIITASREFLMDTAVDNLIGFLAMQGGRALADESGKHFVAGTGSGQPEGILEGATVGVDLAAKDAVTSDEVMDLYHAVIRPYRPNGAWLFNDSTIKAIRKLKDGDDQYLWQPGLQAGEPDRILGRPVFTDTHVPEFGTSSVVGAFGDMSGYYIREVGTLEVVRSDEHLFENDQVAWRFVLRTDGKLVDTAAIRTMKAASS